MFKCMFLIRNIDLNNKFIVNIIIGGEGGAYTKGGEFLSYFCVVSGLNLSRPGWGGGGDLYPLSCVVARSKIDQ